MAKRDRISEILAVKNRRQRHELELGAKRLRQLSTHLRNLGDQPELLRYFPIALVTIVEVQTKLLVQKLVDEGAPYVERAAKLTAEVKFDLNLISAIAGKTISIGELVAHMIRVNNLADIDHVFTTLTGIDFLKQLPKTNDWYKSKGTGIEQPPTLQEPEITFAKMVSLFETRHVLVHEVPDSLDLTADDVVLFHYHVSTFLSAATNMVENLIFGKMPVLVSDWHSDREKRHQEMTQSLQEVLDMVREALTKLRGDSVGKMFDLAQETWRSFVEAESKWYAAIGKGDPLEASFATQRKIDLASARTRDLIDPFEEIVKQLRTNED